MYSCMTFIWFATLILYAWIFLWHEITVYIWGFPCLDYSFDVLFSWDSDLSVYNQSCYQPYSGFPVLWILWYTRSHMFHSCSNPLVFWVWYLCPSWLATWHLYTRLGSVPDSPGFSCPGYGARSVQILPVAVQSSAAVAWTSSRPFGAPSFQTPFVPLEFPISKLVSVLLYCSFMYIPCTLAFAYISDMIFM